MDELLAQLKSYLGAVKPSMYAWLLPSYDLKKLDDLAASGAFPSMSGLASSFMYAIYFNLARYLLTLALFKVILKFPPLRSSHITDKKISIYCPLPINSRSP
jgi:hypothetical protein